VIKLGWNNERGHGAIQVDAVTGALALDEGLTTAALLTVFTWAPATAEEIAAAGLDQQLGWWGDAEQIRDDGEPVIGSKLWLLAKTGTRLSNLRKAEEYVRQAFQWWIDEGLASAVAVTASRPRAGMLALEIEIARADGDAAVSFLWRMTTDAI
jgi:phage gp46-like protein